MTAMLKRLMWPRKGEEIILLQNGRAVVEGIVIHSSDSSVSVLDKSGYITELDSPELIKGIEDRTIVIKKKAKVG